MKYESNILKRLIDTYGVVGNPRYISEIIKEFIIQGKERYPELFTYQADWLAHIDEFGLNPSYTVSYTGQSIYAPNTLERPVKSAILKGSTKYRDIDTGEVLDAFEDGRNLELVSVKMPVLTTTGKNLFDKNKLEDGQFDNFGIPAQTSQPRCRTADFIQVESGSKMTLSKSTKEWFKVFGYDNNKNFISIVRDSQSSCDTFTIPSNVCFIKIKFDYLRVIALDDNIQLEYGTQATPYEPYKSNILSTPEDVTLRGIGEVRDTLDCLTGEVTERIGEIVLDGSEEWNLSGRTSETVLCVYIETRINPEKIMSNFPLNDPLRDNTKEGLTLNGSIRLGVFKNKLETADVSGMKKFLNENNIKIQYTLDKESIKTVGLTILDQNGQNVKQLMSFNGGTHFNTGSLEGSPLPSVTVTVETDLVETIKVCSLDGNTM